MFSIFKYDHRKYENILDSDNKLWFFVKQFIFWLVLLFWVLLIFESIWNNESKYYIELLYCDAVISTIFAFEYLYRLFKAKKKIEFIKNPMRIIDLLSFLPFFLWFFAAWDYLKILRLFRVFRILRVIKKIPLTESFVKSLKDYKEEYKAVLFLFLVILFVGSFFVYFAEKNVIDSKFYNIPISLWWWLVTMTTVWYWDMYPLTNLWKFFATFLIILWPLILALFSAITIMVFSETLKVHERKQVTKKWIECSRCWDKNPHDANYCMKCWKKISLHL